VGEKSALLDPADAKRRLLRLLDRRPDPLGEHHLVVLVLDSCRHDTFLEAEPRNLAAAFGGLDRFERRFSYAPWTAPSHYNLLMGLLPHRSPAHVFASEHYKADFARYNERLGTRGRLEVDFSSLVPELWLPTFLKYKAGYATHAFVSLPVLNRATPLNTDFDHYELMDEHNDLGRILERIESAGTFGTERPSFVLINTGETHYPYTVPGDDPEELPPLTGPHGILRPVPGTGDRRLDEPTLASLRARQVRAVRHLDREVVPRLLDRLPENTWLVVTSDHGELFGESGYFGHGPILHDKVLEVPFAEGRVR